jgi:hypothetical protein
MNGTSSECCAIMADRAGSAEQSSLEHWLGQGTPGLLDLWVVARAVAGAALLHLWEKHAAHKIYAENSSRTSRFHMSPLQFQPFPCMCIHTAANLLVVHINAVSNAPMRASCSEFGRVSFGVEQPCRPAEAEAGSLPTLTIRTNRDFGCRLLSPCRGGHERSAGPGLLGTFLFHKLLTTCQTSGMVKTYCMYIAATHETLSLCRTDRIIGKVGKGRAVTGSSRDPRALAGRFRTTPRNHSDRPHPEPRQ